MKNKRLILSVGIFISLSILVLGALWLKSVKETVKRNYCLSYLHGIGFCIKLYAEDHNGRFPRNLQQLTDACDNLSRSPILLVCPGTGKLPGAVTNVLAWTDYSFIDWPAVLGTNAVPTNFPVAYDRSIGNHRGRGICILTADGYVKWDPNAEWLKKFSAEHPEAKLPMPQ